MKNKRTEEIYNDRSAVGASLIARSNQKPKSRQNAQQGSGSSINCSLSPNENSQKTSFFTRKAQQSQHARSLSKILVRNSMDMENQGIFPNTTKNQLAKSPDTKENSGSAKESMKKLMMSTLGNFNTKSNNDLIFKPKKHEESGQKSKLSPNFDVEHTSKFSLIEKLKGRAGKKIPYTPERTFSLASVTTLHSNPPHGNAGNHTISSLSQFLYPTAMISEDRFPSSEQTEKQEKIAYNSSIDEKINVFLSKAKSLDYKIIVDNMFEIINEILRKNTGIFNTVAKIRGKFDHLLSERYFWEKAQKSEMEKMIKSLEKDYSNLMESTKKNESELVSKIKQINAHNKKLTLRIEELEAERRSQNTKQVGNNNNPDNDKSIKAENQKLRDIILNQQAKIMISKEREAKIKEFLKALKAGGIDVEELEEIFMEKNDDNEGVSDPDQMHQHKKKRRRKGDGDADMESNDEVSFDLKRRGLPKKKVVENEYDEEADISVINDSAQSSFNFFGKPDVLDERLFEVDSFKKKVKQSISPNIKAKLKLDLKNCTLVEINAANDKK